MDPLDREDSPVPLAYAGAAPDGLSDGDPPPDGWLVTSWGVFAATVTLLVLVAVWLYRSRHSGGGENIIGMLAVVTTCVLDAAGLGLSLVVAVFVRSRRRAALLALWPWTLSIVSCVAASALAMLVDHLRR